MANTMIGSARTLALLAIFVVGAAAAAPTSDASAEIDHLREYLSGSGCEFERNGKWHDAASARKHIDRKYRYLLDRDQITSAEQFIERAASRSSTSGKGYRVRCGSGAPVEAARWLGQELTRHRGT
ncbi:MAG TPA: DUF5329 domain-containing protein [Candidatus Saccharimonadia bacterium]|nr:DUF5329 domain-containing protein [Candidatus Saccharimonadia bacterium]